MRPILLNLPTRVTTPRLVLRSPKHGDGKELNAALVESYLELYHWFPWARRNPTVDQSEEFVRQAEANWILKNNKALGLLFFLFEKEHLDKIIGVVAIHEFDWSVPCMELGYWMRTPYTGKGYMLEAINAVTQYAFKVIKVKRLEIRCNPKNIKSIKIPQRLKFRLEARLKGQHMNHITGEPDDTLVYVRFDLKGLSHLDVEWPQVRSEE